MPSSDDYCPISKAVRIFGDRWSLLLVREMLRGVRNFNEFERSLPGISRSTLAERLRRLERTALAERRVVDGGQAIEYRLTEAGRELESIVRSYNDWGDRWLIPDARPGDIDPAGLMSWIGRHVVLDELPERRVVIVFDLRGKVKQRYWLVLGPGEVSLCPDHPGFEEDMWVSGTTTAVYHLFLGRLSMREALEKSVVSVEGPPRLLRSFPLWFRLRR